MVAGVLAFSVVLGGLYMGVQSLAEGRAEWMQQFAGRGSQYILVALIFAVSTAGIGGLDAER